MLDYFKNLTTDQTVYFYIALFSTVLFLLQTIFTFVDLGDGVDFDSDFDGEVDTDLSGTLGFPFNLFTIRGIISFFVLFGWSGFLFSKAGLKIGWTIVLSLICGFIMMVLVGFIYYLAEKLGVSGNYELKDAIGKIGEVYIPIPEKNSGTGKITVIVNNSLKELDAITYNERLNYGDVIKVIDVINEKLVVEKVNNE